MRPGISNALRVPMAVALVCGGVLFVVYVVLVLLGMIELTLLLRGSNPSALAWGFIFLLLLALNTWGLRIALRARHYLGMFSAWQSVWSPSEQGDARVAALAAREAFDAGDFVKAAAMAERAGARLAGLGPVADLAFAYALSGDTVKAIELLELSQSKHHRWFVPAKRFGLRQKAYFEPGHAPELWQLRKVLGTTMICLAVILPLVIFRADRLLAMWQSRNFSATGFQSIQREHFTYYYHDPVFVNSVHATASDALNFNLKFFGLPDSTFGPGQIKVYLCETNEEYLARSPYSKPWEAGSAVASTHSIYLYRFQKNQAADFESVLAHELAHLVYHRIAPQHREDTWLNEGLASYLGYQFALTRLGVPVQTWLMENEFKDIGKNPLPFTMFLAENPQRNMETERIIRFYRQGHSIVNVLVEYYGRELFLRFVRNYGRTGDLNGALIQAYPTLQNGLLDLRAIWDLFMRTP